MWKVPWRPWLMTLAAIFTSFYGSVVRDTCSTSFGNADVSCGSIWTVFATPGGSLQPGNERAKVEGKPTLVWKAPQSQG